MTMKTLAIALRGAVVCSCMGMTMLVGCSADRKITPINERYGLEKHGSGVPHEPSVVSLVRKDRQNKWSTIWHAISFRCEGIVAWNDSIAFGGVTSSSQAADGTLRLLFYSDKTGVVDITEGVSKRAGARGPASARYINLKKDDSMLKVLLEGGGRFTAEIPLDDIEGIVRSIVAQNNKRVFDDVEIHE